MRTVLLTYEFGAGLGHLNRLIAVAQRLEGCRLVFALPDLNLGVPVVQRALGDRAECVQGVVWPAPSDPNVRNIPTHTFADVITLFGFADVERLVAGTERVNTLLGTIKPDLIVADFAPTLRLTSAERIPIVVIGSGYTIPPRGRILSPIRPWVTTVAPTSREKEGSLLAAVNRVRAAQQGPSIDHFSDLFQGEHTFACTLSEFDPYRSTRIEAVYWPFNVPMIANGPPIAERRGTTIFCYLQRNDIALEAVLKAISSLRTRCEVYVQGSDPRLIAAHCSRSVGIHVNPADFKKVLPTTRVLVHHAGLGTTYAGLLAGTPQLVIPQNLEQALNARGLDFFKSSKTMSVSPPPTSASIGHVLMKMLTNDTLHRDALQAAHDFASRRVSDPVAPIADVCNSFL